VGEILASLGLRLHPDKTAVVDLREGREVAARTQRVDGVADWRAGELIPSGSRPKGAPAPPGRTTATCSWLLYDVIGVGL
jgi:hypothetical protein